MEEKRIDKKWMIFGAVYAITVLLIISIANIAVINAWFGYLLRILRPVIVGLTLAYLTNPIFVFFERKLFSRMNPPSVRRFLSILFAYISLIVLAICLIGMILPQLFESLISLLKNYGDYTAAAANILNGLISGINGFIGRFTNKEATFAYVDGQTLINSLTGLFSSVSIGKDGGSLMDMINSENVMMIAGVITNTFSVVADVVLGFFISLYYLSSKEKRNAQIMRMRQAIFSDKINGRISRVVHCFDKSFGGFIKGKALDSLIVGVLLYTLLSIFNVPFALLLAAFIAVLNIIPLIGYLVAVIPTFLIIFLSAPEKAIPFLLVVFLIQQIDTNIICPKILGRNTGVSSLCVIIAISTMGALWGLTGMFLGVPLFAAILTLSDYYLEKNLRKKGLPSEIESYYPGDALVDPVKDSHMTSEKYLRRLEKKVLEHYSRLNKDPDYVPKKADLARLGIYKRFKRYNVIGDFHDDTIVNFCADNEQKRAYLEAEARFEALKKSAASTAEKQD